MSDIELRDDTTPEPSAAREPAPGLLPGELHPHPSPLRYVIIAVVLSAVTAAEVSLYYIQGDVPDALIITLLLAFAIVKFGIVASWYMHLRTDRPIFRRFFTVGAVAAIILFMIVTSTLHIWTGP